MRYAFLSRIAHLAVLAPVFAAAAPKDLPAGEWSSIQAAVRQHRQTVVAAEGGWRAYNVAQQLSAFFDGRGFELRPKQGNWRWGLQLERYGYAGQLRSVTHAKPVADGQHFSYQWDSTMQEWFINGAGAKQELEHGYTLAARPGHGQGLRLYLKVVGGLAPSVSHDRKSVAFFERGAIRAALHYGGLKVVDATGRELASRFSVEAGGLRLEVDDAAAQYPVIIDPVVYNQYLKASPPQVNGFFGRSVAASGDLLAMGAPFEISGGAAYVFAREIKCTGKVCTPVWRLLQHLKAPNGQGKVFGGSVALSGDTLVVGEPDAASVHVYRRSPGNPWSTFTLAATLSPPPFQGNAAFGRAVAVSGETIVVGAHGVNSAYVFTVPAGWSTWRTRDHLFGTSFFGFSVGVSGDTVVVGATSSNYAAVFRGAPGAWILEATLSPVDPGQKTFGQSIAVEGDMVVVGAPTPKGSGAAYVFSRNGSAWSWFQTLKPAVGVPVTFGASVALSGNHIAVATGFEYGDGSNPPINNRPDSGAAWLFTRTTGLNVNYFLPDAYIKAPNPDRDDVFGLELGVAVNGNTVLVGAPGEDGNGSSLKDNSLSAAGAAYTFDIVKSVAVTFQAASEIVGGFAGGMITTTGSDCAPGTYSIPVTLQWTSRAACTVKFTPAFLHEFSHWEDGSKGNPRTITVPVSNAGYTVNVVRSRGPLF